MNTTTAPKLPTMQPVESSNIASCGYDPETKKMYLKFKSGGLYSYSDVPAKAHAAFMEAESKGKHFSGSFAGKFKHEKLA